MFKKFSNEEVRGEEGERRRDRQVERPRGDVKTKKVEVDERRGEKGKKMGGERRSGVDRMGIFLFLVFSCTMV